VEGCESSACVAQLQPMPRPEIDPRHAIKKTLRREALPVAGRAHVVRSIACEQHADVHLVRTRLEPTEPRPETWVLSPLPCPLTLDDEPTLLFGELRPRHLHVDAMLRAVLLEQATFVTCRASAPRTDSAAPDRSRFIRDHLRPVDADGATEAATTRACAH